MKKIFVVTGMALVLLISSFAFGQQITISPTVNTGPGGNATVSTNTTCPTGNTTLTFDTNPSNNTIDTNTGGLLSGTVSSSPNVLRATDACNNTVTTDVNVDSAMPSLSAPFYYSRKLTCTGLALNNNWRGVTSATVTPLWNAFSLTPSSITHVPFTNVWSYCAGARWFTLWGQRIYVPGWDLINFNVDNGKIFSTSVYVLP